MLRLAHLVNPVAKGPESDLAKAQPITFETMRIAQRAARGKVAVDLVQACFPEDAGAAPPDFLPARPLDRSVQDCADVPARPRLPLLADLLERLHERVPEADAYIYTNVDIALQPHFYVKVAQLLGEGIDALSITRRTISGDHGGLDQLVLMYADRGKPHPGHDCFVITRELLPRLRLGSVCIGARRVGATMVMNLAYLARDFRELRDEYLTFHLGEDRAWNVSAHDLFHRHNQLQWEARRAELEAQRAGPRHPIVARLSARDGQLRKRFGLE